MIAKLLPFRSEPAEGLCHREFPSGRTGIRSFAPRRLPAGEPGLPSLPRQRPILLLADREPADLLAACRPLEQAGFEVRRTSTAAETATLFSTVRPDLAVIDSALPDGDGFELCKAIRRTPEGRETPLVIAADAEDYQSVRKTQDAGASDFVLRPINWLILSRRLSNLMEADHSRRRLRASRAMLREAEEAAGLASWSCDSSTGRIEWSPEAATFLGFEDPTDGRPEAFLAAVHPDDRPFVEAEIRSAARERRPFAAEHRIRRPSDGAVRFIRHCADFSLDEDGEALWLRGIVQDVTEKVRVEEQIWRLSNLDGLTGLPNRAMLQHLLGYALPRAAHAGRLVAALFLDIDRFEEINERHGPAEGEKLIVEVADRLEQCLRRGDPVAPSPHFERADSLARLSGDEFVVVLTDVEVVDDIARVAQRILDGVSGSYRVGSAEVFISVSIGIAVNPQDGDEPGLLIQHAQTALFQVKRRGRGSYRFYSETLNNEVAARVDIEPGLHRALERNELSLSYQPILNGKSGAGSGFEALLRWPASDAPVGGPPPPPLRPHPLHSSPWRRKAV